MKLASIGTTSKRCSCLDEHGKELGAKCPKLTRAGGGYNSRHGNWGVRFETQPDTTGNAIRLRFGGFGSQDTAEDLLHDIRELLAVPDNGPRGDQARHDIAELIRTCVRNGRDLPSAKTVSQRYRSGATLEAGALIGPLLWEWHKGLGHLSSNTRKAYGTHIRLYLEPNLGCIEYDRLRRADLVAMFDTIDAFNVDLAAARTVPFAEWTPEMRERFHYRKRVRLPTKHRIKACLSSFLTHLMADGDLTINVAQLYKLPTAKVTPMVWTDARTERWKVKRDKIEKLTRARTKALRGGDHGLARTLAVKIDVLWEKEKPSKVMVWTLQQTGAFLDHVSGHWLYPLFHLVAFAGLRRGEAAGLRWEDVDLDRGVITVSQQLVQIGWDVEVADPKTDESQGREIALNDASVKVLRLQKQWQETAAAALGAEWEDNDLVFTRLNGSPLRPSWISDEFVRLVNGSGLPPIHFHGLRHGAASIAYAAGATEFAIMELLGHTDVRTTRGYTRVFKEITRTIAEKSEAMIPREQEFTLANIHQWLQTADGAIPGPEISVEGLSSQPREVYELLDA
ncbi:tyrosine-type recombinase/integrase [Longispora sp. NPDC051575]|uniref:tyrosine-type recombinase/integrase n=1 Tax=Longispora sp. NPDC051575 TaxID=3154943 RepID=UPI00344003AB